MIRRLAALVLALGFLFSFCAAEEQEESGLYVITKSLYGRIRPGKKYQALCEFEYGAKLHPTGRMSADHMWIEIESAENYIVWCSVDYLTERNDVFYVYSLNDERIRIRKHPGAGKVTGYARKEEVLEITQVVMGYGRCVKGWVDLSYFIEDCE